MTRPYPLLFEPVYQSYLWGGDWIARHYGRDLPPGCYAESWEVSDRAEGESIVRNGPWQGQRLSDLLHAHSEMLLGAALDRFPLLIKLIDAQQTLSLQVHPNDATAAQYGGEAKTEMWYVLDATAEACVYAGWNRAVNAQQVRAAIADGSLQDLLQVVPVKAGDAILMHGGYVHAIGAGCRLLEVQQNSNTTYRLYDWGRVGADGQPRPLHIEDGLCVLDWQVMPTVRTTPRRIGFMGANELWDILRTEYFRIEELRVHEEWPSAHDGRTCQILFVSDGKITLAYEGGQLEIVAGTSCLIPAALTNYTLTTGDAAKVIRIMPPAQPGR
jgi:mannose-6-phosphate isomerase